MAKKATSVEEQIEILKARKMVISDEAKAKEHLLDIGYYRLGFYWHYFEKNKKTHEFCDGTDIKDAIDLYYLDVDLKNLLLKYIYRIEVHFRTQVVYTISNYHKDSPAWFSDRHLVKGFNRTEFEKLIYTNLRVFNPHIIKHHNKRPNDTYAPAWKTLEFLAFGQVLRIFSSVKDESIKNKIAEVYGLRNVKNKTTEAPIPAYLCLEEYLKAILNIRNICSHSGVLFDYCQGKGIRRIPDHRYRNKTNSQENLYVSINLIVYMLSRISVNRAKELKEEVYIVIKRAVDKNSKLKEIIKKYIGYPLD